MDESLLRQFITGTLRELRMDPHMARILKGSDLRLDQETDNHEAQNVAKEWLEDLGGDVSSRDAAAVTRFVTRRWPGIVRRFRGNMVQAQQTMYNLLDARFNGLRVYDR